LLFTASGLFARDVPFQFSHRGSILKIKFSPDGTELLSYSSGEQDLCLWNVKSGRLLWKRPISFIQKSSEHYALNAIAWSPDQKFIATGSNNGTLQLWDAATGKFLWRADAHRKEVTAVGFSPDGQTIASTALDDKTGPVKLIRTADGEIIKTLDGEACAGIAIAFDDSGKKMRDRDLVWSKGQK
jgi:WD40 repeat protein